MTGSSCWTIPRRTIGSSLNDDPLDHVRCWPVLHLPLARKNPGSRSNLLPTQSMLGIRVEHATAIPNQAMHWASPEKIENARDCLQHVCVCVCVCNKEAAKVFFGFQESPVLNKARSRISCFCFVCTLLLPSYSMHCARSTQCDPLLHLHHLSQNIAQESIDQISSAVQYGIPVCLKIVGSDPKICQSSKPKFKPISSSRSLHNEDR